MYDNWKNTKRGFITEERISTLLPRYSVKTLLQLLQEVAISATERIDWNAIVKSTTTGISNAREYQMLWRHLAYGQTLTDQFDDTNPLDDDSDLEYEVEAYPVVSRRSSAEASACVEALVASEYPIGSHVPNNITIEAPLTVNIPMFKVPSDSSLPANAMQGTNIIVPVSVPNEPFSSGTSGKERPNRKSGADVPPRRKSKDWSNWSTEDNLKLTAAVKKYGEQDWANIAGGDFKNERTSEELSQRWASICLEKGNFGTRDSAEHFEVCKVVARAMNAARIYNSNLSKPEVDNCTSASGNTLGGNTQGNQASISLSRPVNQTQDLQVALTRPEVDDNGKKNGDTITTGKEIHDEN